MLIKGDVTRDDSQHSVAMLEQCCDNSKQHSNNVVTLCYAKNRRYESSRVTSPQRTQTRILKAMLHGTIRNDNF